MSMMQRPALALILVLAAGLSAPAQQRPSPTFRVEVNYVEIDAVVTDAQGRFVRDLTRDDFEIIEEGTPQSINAFTMVDLPVARVDPPLFRGTAIEPDVSSNLGEFNGRVILIVLDDLQTDFRRTQPVRLAAKQFVRRFVGVNDLVAVVHTGSGAKSGQEFTSSQPRLLKSIDKFSGQKPRRGEQASDEEKAFKARASLNSLKASAEFLSNIHGRRKAVVWFGEGVDYDIEGVAGPATDAGRSITQPGESAPVIRDAMRDLIAVANRAGVSFYGVDARGVGAGLDEAIDLTGLDDDFQADNGMAKVMNETRRSQDFLRTISTETGGFAVLSRGDLNGSFAKIIEQNSSYYLLGYYPKNDKRDGRFRKVDVRVKRPGLEVKARGGYSAPKGKAPVRETSAAAAKAPADLRVALDSPLPVSGLGLRVFAAPFTGPSRKGSVAMIIEVDPGRLAFQPAESGGFTEDVEIIILPVNASGKPVEGTRDQIPMRLSPRSYDLVRQYGFRLARRLDLPPGQYQLHIAAKASNGNAIGALRYDLDVPDFDKQPLAMSGIALMAQSAGRMMTAPLPPTFTDVLPVAATAMRQFPSGDTLSIFTEIYDRQLATPHSVGIKTTVTGDDGRVLFSTSDTRKSEEIGGKAGGYGHTQKISLAGYKPGRYVLRVEAASSLSNGGSAARELEFTIR
jgi:VWFA-related protein